MILSAKVASKFQFEASARVVVCAWNAVVLDEWNKTDKNEKSLLFTLSEEPKEMQPTFRTNQIGLFAIF